MTFPRIATTGWKTRMLVAIALLAAVVVFAGCTQDMPGYGGDDGNGRVFLRLGVSGMSTRSGSGVEGYEEGSGIDSYIDPADVSALIFDGDGVLRDVLSPDAVSSPSEGDVAVSADIRLDRYGMSECVTIVVIANFGGFMPGYGGMFEEGVTLLSDLEEMEFSLPDNQEDIRSIPMRGDMVLPLTAVAEGMEARVMMRRLLARIEIADEMTDGCRIVSVTMLEGELGKRIVFTGEEREGKDGKVFYAYLPERALGDDPQGDDRLVIVEADRGDGGGTSAGNLYLSPYADGKPRAASPSEEAWRRILPNHLYRFAVTGMETPLQVLDKIVIVWSKDAYHGKFSGGYIQVSDSDGNCYSALPEKAGLLDYGSDRFAYLVDLSVLGCGYEDVRYQIFDSGRNPLSVMSNLCDDYIRVADEKGSTCFYLTDDFIGGDAYVVSAGFYPTDCPYRFYCRNESYHSIELEIGGTALVGGKTPEVFVADDRGYKYVEFTMPGNMRLGDDSVTFIIRDATGKVLMDGQYETYDYARMGRWDIFPQEIGGARYYVFYFD